MMMNKKVIIDLNGVVFEPIDRDFSAMARARYGRVRGAAVTFAYKYGIGRGAARDAIETILYQSAKNPKVRDGALSALEAISKLPDVTMEFCGQVAFPGQEYMLEKKYRAIAPCMNMATHYELISPFESKRSYLLRSTKADENSLNYILGTRADDLDWPAKWRIMPVLIRGASDRGASICNKCNPRVFKSLHDFQDFLSHRR